MSVSQALSVTEIAGSHNVANNTSKVRILWTSTQTGESHNLTTRTATYYIHINDNAMATPINVSYTLPKNTTKTIVDTIITVPHREDGTATVTVATWMDTRISAGVVEKSQTVTLTPIARASIIDSVADVILGNSCNVRWNPKSAVFRYKLKFSLGTWSYTTGIIYPNKTTAYTYDEYTLPLDVANQVTSREGKMTVTLYTYSNSIATSQVGSADSKTFKVTVPENEDTKPTVGLSIAPVSTLKAPFNTLYIQGHSKVKATLDVHTQYNATVLATNITVEGVNYSSPYESAILNHPGTVSVKATVKDSREYYGTDYKDIEVLEYNLPYVRAKSNETEIVAARCDSSANLTDSGTYLKIKAKVVWSKLTYNGAQNNYAKIKFRYRKESGSYSSWQTILDSKTDNSDEVITAPLLNGALDIKSNYQVQIIATDDLYESTPVTVQVPSDSVYMDRPAGGKSMGLGGYSTGDDILDVYWRTKARGGLSLFGDDGTEIPLDTTIPIPRNQVASGWNPDDLESGVYIVANNIALKSGDNVIMYNGALIQMQGDASGNVKIQLALPIDENRNPMYRLCWYSNWSAWHSMKL